jgi:hypothetical protein
MSYKTDRLVELFPDIYAAQDRESVLYHLLDTIGAEFMVADEKIKRLLKSHWVRYAQGRALDHLASIYGVTRRNLRSGRPESDEAFRRRLQSTVPLFTGGGTRRAVLGAVRSALGLPFDLNQLNLPPEYDALRREVDALITLTEFSPQGDKVMETTVQTLDNASELLLNVTASTVSQSSPQIEWTFQQGSGRKLSLERMDSHEGLKSRDNFWIPAGKTLVFSAENGRLVALIDRTDVTDQFTNLNGTTPPLLPNVPQTPSRWKFRAQSATYDAATFDGETFDLPRFYVALRRLRFEPLTFDVQVPYFLKEAVEALARRYKYTGEVFVFEGIKPEHIQEVVDDVRAAGVRGSVHFSLTFFEDHRQREGFAGELQHAKSEQHNVTDSLVVANVSQQRETQQMAEHLTLVGVFDISPFDGPYGFE